MCLLQAAISSSIYAHFVDFAEKSKPNKENMGPDCYKAQSTVSDLLDVCEFACMALWSRHKEKYLQCHSPTECFNQDFATASKVSDAWEQGFDLALAQELSSSCSFGKTYGSFFVNGFPAFGFT